ncbi:hypothetical protein Tco_0654364 [Tanacetum coccineum]|uniref:Uncharacterized protein n=1 Tax=Tanacetum coccineum TaxID=301880 RepID=A0ABQ4X353_9ASTR
MVAYLEKTKGNAEFHEIIDFLTRSSIHHALTVSDQAKEIQKLKARIKNLKKQAKPGRKSAKGEPSVHKDKLFDEIPEDSLDYMETGDAQDVGRTRDVVDEEKENAEDVLSTKIVLSTAQKKVTDDQKQKIDPKDKGKKKIEEEDESESDSDGIPEAEKKFKQLATDEEDGLGEVQEEWARIEAELDFLLRSFKKKKESKFTIEERAKFLHDTIAAQRKFLARQRSEAIRNRPPTKNQLRNQMMTYLKQYEDFYFYGFAEDERLIKRMNEKGIDSSKMKLSRRKIKKKKIMLRFVTYSCILDSEIMEKKSVIARLNKVSSPDGDYLVIYRANRNFRAFNYLMNVLHIFDRQDLFHLYDLMRAAEYFRSSLVDGSTKIGRLSWRLYESCGVCILEFEDGIVIHMLVERRYPLSKDLLQRMLDLGLEVERESSVALDLIRFIKQQIDEE